MDLFHNLLDTCTTLTRRVENLEQDKISQALEIIKLRQRVKKLERRNKLKVLKLRRLNKRTSWNEFSSSMASAVICLSTCRKFNFSKYIFDSLVKNMDSSTKFYMVGKGCSRVETLLFEGMIVAPQAGEGAAEVKVDDVPAAGIADEGAAEVHVDAIHAAIDEPTTRSPTPPTQPPPPSQDQPSTSQGMIIANMDADVDVTLEDIAKDVAVDAEIEESADVQGRQAESQA
nr:hypothetical protein [Tanacetum cinerariifolium]